MSGYFGIGVEGVSKAMNLGALMRTAHAFGAGFVFTVAAHPRLAETRLADTSATDGSLPLFQFASVEELRLPRGCDLVGLELTDASIALPSFRHPRRAAYVLGPERGALSEAMRARCSFLVEIPTRFSINLALAGALAMYDRMLTVGRFAERPVAAGGPADPLPPLHDWGAPRHRPRPGWARG